MRAARREGAPSQRASAPRPTLLRSRGGRADVALFHEFAPSPSGGGHQFLRALVRELEGRGLEVELGTDLRANARRASSTRSTSTSGGSGVRATRGADGAPRRRADRRLPGFRRRHGRADRRDQRRIWRPRRSSSRSSRSRSTVSSASSCASRWSSRTRSTRRSSTLPRAASRWRAGRYRLVATSWSDNPRKGVGALEWLDRNLDPDRFELTFAGRPADGRFRADPRRRAARLARAGRVAAHAGPLRRTRAGTTRARTPSWKRSRAACRPPTATAAVIRSSSAKAASPSARTASRRAIERLVSEIDARRASI